MNTLIFIALCIMAFALLILLFSALFSSINFITDYFSDNNPVISFKLFTNLYSLFPKKWELASNYVIYHSKDEYINLHFNFIDTFKYICWYKKKRKKDKEEEKIKTLLSLTDEWRSEVNSIKENSIKQIVDAAEKSKFYIEKIKEEESNNRNLARKCIIPDDIFTIHFKGVKKYEID